MPHHSLPSSKYELHALRPGSPLRIADPIAHDDALARQQARAFAEAREQRGALGFVGHAQRVGRIAESLAEPLEPRHLRRISRVRHTVQRREAPGGDDVGRIERRGARGVHVEGEARSEDGRERRVARDGLAAVVIAIRNDVVAQQAKHGAMVRLACFIGILRKLEDHEFKGRTDAPQRVAQRLHPGGLARRKRREAGSRQRAAQDRHPFTHTTCLSVYTTSTRSFCASITASMSL
jgi:hypothetical protein